MGGSALGGTIGPAVLPPNYNPDLSTFPKLKNGSGITPMPAGFIPPTGAGTQALVEYNNPTTGQTWTAPGGGFTAPQGWVQGSAAQTPGGNVVPMPRLVSDGPRMPSTSVMPKTSPNGAVSQIENMPGRPTMGGKGGANQPITASQPTPMAQTSQPNVYNQSAQAYTQALQGTQAGMQYQPMMVGGQGYNPYSAASTGYNAATAGAQGYNAATAGSTGYGAATAGSRGYTGATAGAQGYNAGTVGSQGYGAAQMAGARPINAQNVNAGQLASTNLSNYMNPFTQNVIDRSLADIGGQQQTAMGLLGAQAQAAKAFGGSRQGIAEAETNKGFIKQMADTSANLNLQGYTQAQQAAQQDISGRMQAGLANQGANLTAQQSTAANMLQQQAANQAALNQSGQFGAGAANQAALSNQAAFNQAGQFGANAVNQASLANQASQNQANQFTSGAFNQSALSNQAALNQAGQFGAGAANQAAIANQAARNQAGQFGAGAVNQASLSNQAAFNQAGQFGAGAFNQAAMANQGAYNQAGQFGAGAANQAALANQQASLAAAPQRLGASSQMGGLANTGFNFGQQLGAQQAQQGALQQALNQALIDAGKSQYGGFTNAPNEALTLPLAALGVSNMGQRTQTTSQNPGLFNYLSLLMG